MLSETTASNMSVDELANVLQDHPDPVVRIFVASVLRDWHPCDEDEEEDW